MNEDKYNFMKSMTCLPGQDGSGVIAKCDTESLLKKNGISDDCLIKYRNAEKNEKIIIIARIRNLRTKLLNDVISADQFRALASEIICNK